MKRLLLVMVVAGCTQSSQKHPDAGVTTDAGHNPYEDLVQPDPSLDATMTILRGPYLQAAARGTVTIFWHTDGPSTSRVSFGPEGGATQEASGKVFQQLPVSDDPLIAGTLPAGFQHEVVLTGLTTNTRYTYTVLSTSTPVTASFTTVPEEGDAFDFAVLGDTRTNDDAHGQVIQGVIDLVPQARFVMNTGDLVTVGGDEGSWDDFFRIEVPLIKSVPLFPVFGNHEQVLGRTLFESLFKPPPTSTSPSDTWYSGDVGDVHFAMVDTYVLPSEPHLEWLERDLTSTTKPHKIVLLHEPLFSRSHHEPNVEIRNALLPVLRATGTRIVMTGHNHCYERFFGDGIQFVVTGGGGSESYGTDEHPDADNTGAERIFALSTLHLIKVSLDGPRMMFEVIGIPERARIDCFVVDNSQPGVNVACP